MYLDILGAVKYARASGAKRVSVLGGSMGGGAAARASAESKEGEINDLILLAAASSGDPAKLKGRKLFIVAEGGRGASKRGAGTCGSDRSEEAGRVAGQRACAAYFQDGGGGSADDGDRGVARGGVIRFRHYQGAGGFDGSYGSPMVPAGMRSSMAAGSCRLDSMKVSVF